jgi:MFS family permease
MTPLRNAIYRLLMSSRIVLATILVAHLVPEVSAVCSAVVASMLLHHFRAFDTDGAKRTGGEKAFYILSIITCLGVLLFCVGQPWLSEALRIALGIAFGFLVPDVVSYAVLPAPEPEKPQRFYVDQSPRHR